ncbi:hypothetical protein vBValSR12Z_107 [Vibrio phage vB_ValS_R12Z]|nr:hypothetical protein [Vibrio phage vB_VpS_C2]
MEIKNGKMLMTIAEYNDIKDRGLLLKDAHGADRVLYRGFAHSVVILGTDTTQPQPPQTKQ